MPDSHCGDGGTGSTPLRAASTSSVSAFDTTLGAGVSATASGCALCTARWQRDGLGREHLEPSPPSSPSPKRGADSPLRRSRSGACLALGPTHAQRYTRCEVALHASEYDCWLWAHRTVYDVTAFLHRHPGGHKSLLGRAGLDASVDFDFHSAGARQLWAEYEVGALVDCARAAGVAPAISCAIQ